MMARGFTEEEKQAIQAKLILACEQSWALNGYKRTNIDELCAKAGISKGAFYLFYESKEILFCDVLDVIQARLLALVQSTISNTPTKEEIGRVLKLIYREYEKTNIITQRNSPEFVAFLNRAPSEWVASSQMISDHFMVDTLFNANLTLKIDQAKAVGIFNGLLSLILNKDILGYDHFEVFSFLLDSALDDIYV
ncbi:TetR/AcrR family transcriptional regulator [Paenibacillus guangzhouensis]|uniref:TetR/AcrR family transcriptional regulator n=1 Tax=Paenibacillus guangzhouensis TaxID=1473112 RepID=UPI001266D270|nr:TetR/AcrR family transcriptional regulator [Paenibacillus guangzhouensis]